ncbi:MAG: histidine phosphatase family protein [Thermoleophilia bacterium]|nr:histidine phosphatase family protein [Thermoleophilia bacterium]
MADRQKAIYLIRHGRTEGNVSDRLAGSTDQPLDSCGLSQAEDLAVWFAWRLKLSPEDRVLASPGRPSVLCLSSPLMRARQTAEVVAARLGVPVVIDGDLAEMDFGDWEGRTVKDIVTENPEAFEVWLSPEDDTCFPGGETLRAFEERTHRALRRIMAVEDEVVLVFTHGGVVRTMACALLGLGRESMWKFKLDPAAVLYFDVYGESAVLAGLWNAVDRWAPLSDSQTRPYKRAPGCPSP